MVQVAIRANCWDGKREKTLLKNGVIKVEGMHVIIQDVKDSKWRMDPKLKALIGFGVPIAFLAGGLPPIGLGRAIAGAVSPSSVAQAPVINPEDAVPAMGVPSAVHAKILHAFDPLVNLIQDLAYPIAAVMIATGSIFIMVGNKEKGMQMLQHAALGYILVQLVPLMLNLLVGVGGSV